MVRVSETVSLNENDMVILNIPRLIFTEALTLTRAVSDRGMAQYDS